MKAIFPSTLLALSLIAGAATAAPLIVPFDFSDGEIGLNVTVAGKPHFMILDTGVDPSVIGLAQAQALGLTIDRGAGGEASGEGNDASSQVFPTSLTGLAIGGRDFGPIEALAFDTAGLSARMGRTLDGVLGYSFLKDKIALIDYPASTLTLLDNAGQEAKSIATCRQRWSIPLEGYPDDAIPKVPGFRLGAASGSISLDTGSNSGINLYQAALALPGLKDALTEAGVSTFAGGRGVGQAKKYVLNAPVGFGPFTLPAGQEVTVRDEPGADDRIANVGNRLFAAMKLKILFDYPGKTMTFYGECGPIA